MSDTQVLRGYVERDPDGSWFAICIDVNIYARADSAEAAKKKLDAFVLDYVTEALERDRAYFNQLVPRPAPVRFLLKYHFYRIVDQIHKKLKQQRDQEHRPFKRRMPLAPSC